MRLAKKSKSGNATPLDLIYTIVYFDAIVAKVREDGKVSNRAIYLALGVNI